MDGAGSKMKNIPGLCWLTLGLVTVFTACDRNPVESRVHKPSIRAVGLNYSRVNQTLFISADVTDPDGWDDIDSVTFSLYRVTAPDAVSETLFLRGRLSDAGPPQDIIQRDGVFSFLIGATALQGYEGYYRVRIEAYDRAGNISEQAKGTALAMGNTPPDIFLLYAPTTFEKADTLKFYVRATDLQGYTDIVGVFYDILQPNGIYASHPTWRLRDDGVLYDKHAGDGIFSVYTWKSPESKLQGLYKFYFYARDLAGAYSDTIVCSITNPGVTVLYPDLTDTLRAGHTVTIRWESAYITQVKIEYSVNANLSIPTWTTIATVNAASGEYNWIVPGSGSYDKCKIRISDAVQPNRYDLSDNYFLIRP